MAEGGGDIHTSTTIELRNLKNVGGGMLLITKAHANKRFSIIHPKGGGG